MQTTALLKKEAPKGAVPTIGKFTNPLQRKANGEENDALQMKQNPLQLQAGLDEDEEPLQLKKAPVQLMDGQEDAEEEPLQMKQNPLQRMEAEDEELLQKKKKLLQLKKENYNLLQLKQSSNTSLQLQKEETAAPQQKKNDTGLPDNLKAGVEALSGYSMDDVKVHYNSDKPAQLQALAYAQGTDIHLSPGQEHHLPHEAWHVVQQKQCRVQPTIQMKEGIAINDDEELEQEADTMGQKSLNLTMFNEMAQLMRDNKLISRQNLQLRKNKFNPVDRNDYNLAKINSSQVLQQKEELTRENNTYNFQTSPTPRNRINQGILSFKTNDINQLIFDSSAYIQRMRTKLPVIGEQITSEYYRLNELEAIFQNYILSQIESIENETDMFLRNSEAYVRTYRLPILKSQYNQGLIKLREELKSQDLESDHPVTKKELKAPTTALQIAFRNVVITLANFITDLNQSYENRPITKEKSDIDEEDKVDTFISFKDDEKKKGYQMIRGKKGEAKIRAASGEKDFEEYSGGMSVRDAVYAAITELDVTGSASFKYSRHDFQPSTTNINLQIQLGGSRPYRPKQGDTSSTLVVVNVDLWDSMLKENKVRLKKVIEEAHKISFEEEVKVELLPVPINKS